MQSVAIRMVAMVAIEFREVTGEAKISMREGGFEPPQVLPHKILSPILRLGSHQLASDGVRNPSPFSIRDATSRHLT